MSRSRLRWSWSVPVALVSVLFLAGNAFAAVTFGAQTKVGPIYTWNYGNSLESTSTKLHALWATDCVPPSNTCSTYASDAGPYQGVYYQRSGITDPPVWSAGKRLSQATLHAERPTLASDGDNVYAGWVTQTSYDAFDDTAKRVFYVRRSSDQGATWGPTVIVSPGTGRVDYPILAAADGRVYAIWTDANTGNIRFATGTPSGAGTTAKETWVTKSVGTTTSTDQDLTDGDGGKYGYPTVAASDNTAGSPTDTVVGIGWFSTQAGAKLGKVSANGGASFAAGNAGSTTLTSASDNDTIHYMEGGGQDDGVDNTIALIYETATSVEVRTYSGTGALSAPTTVFGPWPLAFGGKTYLGSYGPAVQPYGAGGLITAFPGCQNTVLTTPCDYGLNKTRMDLLYREKKPGGSFGSLVRLAAATTNIGAQQFNDSASIVYQSGATPRRFILYNGWNKSYADYQLYMKIGSGIA